ncbi:hypothetical protein [Flammeovirga aprica]|uniref:Uncharacterized protein n=1 Tax=Flammeovirga aprica JL-4 TaxID=694437 RepID=A0A7X9XC46_9BACT|nr:hypothetical protein [Flammeovirga aprica]NME71264.1 hypothetical protein [Flammeovirga aprica JL-4]
MNLYHVKDLTLQRQLIGYWGLSEKSKIVYFQKQNDNKLYSIFSIAEDKNNQKNYFCGQLGSTDICYESVAEKIDTSNCFLVKMLVLPLDGVNIKYKNHVKSASFGKLIYSLEYGPIWFNYNPDENFTILPWTEEWVFGEVYSHP